MPLGLGKTSIAISPDGTRVVYVASRNGTRHLVVRDLGSFELRPLRGTDGAVAPFFSPDGNAIGFFSENALKTVSLSGGDPVTVTEARQARGGVWLADGSIVFGNFEGAQLVQVPRSGAPRIVANSSYSFQSMAALPQTSAVLTDIRSGPNPDFNTVEAVSLADGGRKVLVRSGTHPFYRDGRLFFLRSGSLYAVRFDPVTLVVTGSPVAILDGIRTETQGAGQVALSEEGTLVYVEGATAWQGTPVWVTRDGMAQRVGAPERVYGTFALSPDGRRVAFEVAAATTDIWIYELGRGTFSRLTQDGDNRTPVWSPDGRVVAYNTIRDGMRTVASRPVDGSGPETRLWSGSLQCAPYAWSPDAKSLAMGCESKDSSEDLYILTLGDPTLRPFVITPFSDWGAHFSPDGKWIAYITDASGQYEVVVRPYPGPGSLWQISIGGGEEPVWSGDGREIFYRNGTKWMSVGVSTTGQFSATPPRVMFEGPYINVPNFSYDLAPDGRFLLLQGPPASPAMHFNVVLNWTEELKRIVPR
jgi:eukaryotic-like serine/threonine-protein kinase